MLLPRMRWLDVLHASGMSTDDVNTGSKWTAHFTNWQRLSVINHTCTTNRNLLTNVKWVQQTSQDKKKKKTAPEP